MESPSWKGDDLRPFPRRLRRGLVELESLDAWAGSDDLSADSAVSTESFSIGNSSCREVALSGLSVLPASAEVDEPPRPRPRRRRRRRRGAPSSSDEALGVASPLKSTRPNFLAAGASLRGISSSVSAGTVPNAARSSGAAVRLTSSSVKPRNLFKKPSTGGKPNKVMSSMSVARRQVAESGALSKRRPAEARSVPNTLTSFLKRAL